MMYQVSKERWNNNFIIAILLFFFNAKRKTKNPPLRNKKNIISIPCQFARLIISNDRFLPG